MNAQLTCKAHLPTNMLKIIHQSSIVRRTAVTWRLKVARDHAGGGDTAVDKLLGPRPKFWQCTGSGALFQGAQFIPSGAMFAVSDLLV